MLEYIAIAVLAVILAPVVIGNYRWLKFKHRHDDDNIIG